MSLPRLTIDPCRTSTHCLMFRCLVHAKPKLGIGLFFRAQMITKYVDDTPTSEVSPVTITHMQPPRHDRS